MTEDLVRRELPAVDGATQTGQLAASELKRGDVLAGRFRIETLLGIGGMGVVYRARDLKLDVDVALKLLRPELARKPEAFERFRQELLLARQVSSPHVVRIHDIAEHDGRWFISMDFVDGESLERRLDRLTRLDLEPALAIVRGLLEGLAAAAQRGVVHRDLKPANVLLDAHDQAYITDFGVARTLGATGMTQSGMIVGTPEYLSPEQARGETVDARSDLYTVGLILHEMLSGAVPFAGGTPAETVMQRIVRPPPSLARARPDLPRWLHAFCDRLTALRPAQRFATAKDALRALETRRVPRAPLDRRVPLVALLVLVGIFGIVEFVRRLPPPAPVAAPRVPETLRYGVLPFDAADAELAPLARAVEAQLGAWLRSDANVAAVPRRRVLDAIARTAPDLHGEALLRQLPDVARAAGATRVLRGALGRAGAELVLDLSLLDPAQPAQARRLQVRGADAAALHGAVVAQLPAWLAPDLKPGPAPALPSAELPRYGRALLALDRRDAAAAAQELEALPLEPAAGALVDLARLDAQEGADQALPAQATREAALRAYANDATPWGRELAARALSGADRADDAQKALAAAVQAWPNDAALALLDAAALGDGGRGQDALALLERSVQADPQDSRAWFLLGRTAIQLGQAQRAVDDYLVRALVLDTRNGNAADEAQTRNALGIGYERLGQLDAAAEQYARAVAMREKLGDNAGLAKTLRNLAIVQAERGERDAATRTLDRVKGLLEKLGDRASIADLDNDRGVVAEEQGNFAEALAAYRQALALRRELDLPDKIAESLNNVGYASYHLGDFDNALVYWEQALGAYRTLDDRSGALHIEQSIGLLDIARGHFAAARERLDGTLRSAQDHQLPEEAAVAYAYLAELALVEGRYADADAAATRAGEVFARRADPRGQAEAALLHARVALALGDAAGAASALAGVDAEQVNAEQRAIHALATARRAALAGERAQLPAQLDAAAAAAAAAHSAALGAQVQMEKVRQALAGGDVARAAQLLAAAKPDAAHAGDVPLQLAWIELEIATALRQGSTNQAAARYRRALALLKGPGRHAYAPLLHRLGARALAASPAEARAAAEAADAARTQLLADAPAERRADLEAALDRRLREEAGDGR